MLFTEIYELSKSFLAEYDQVLIVEQVNSPHSAPTISSSLMPSISRDISKLLARWETICRAYDVLRLAESLSLFVADMALLPLADSPAQFTPALEPNWERGATPGTSEGCKAASTSH